MERTSKRKSAKRMNEKKNNWSTITKDLQSMKTIFQLLIKIEFNRAKNKSIERSFVKKSILPTKVESKNFGSKRIERKMSKDKNIEV